MNTPMLGRGLVRHTRLRPVRHAFAYPTFFLFLPLRSMRRHGSGDLAVNRAGWMSFHDADHGDGRGPERGGALAWIEEVLRGQGIGDADGEIWLHCYPRVLGYTFKPVSFWYCHRADGSLRAILAEVNNTFGERHGYLLEQPRYGRPLHAAKVFHVSPFCRVSGEYTFRFLRTERDGVGRTVVRIDLGDADGELLQTSVSGELQPFHARLARATLWRQPAMTLALIARIHWQALRLWLKRVPFFGKPVPPAEFITTASRRVLP